MSSYNAAAQTSKVLLFQPKQDYCIVEDFHTLAEIRGGRAHWQCEWCDARHSDPHPITGAKVVLTVAPLDQNPAHNDRANVSGVI